MDKLNILEINELFISSHRSAPVMLQALSIDFEYSPSSYILDMHNSIKVYVSNFKRSWPARF